MLHRKFKHVLKSAFKRHAQCLQGACHTKALWQHQRLSARASTEASDKRMEI